MAYQYVREPLRAEAADALCHACETVEEKLVIWTLLDTGLTLAIQKGISLAAIQKILGHDRLTTTASYLNLTDTHIVEEYAQKW
jgi:site-specific recombinase XerD